MANKAVSEKSLTVLNYLKEIGDANVTAADIAEALGMEVKTVNGVVTAGLARNKGLAERVEAQIEVEGEDGPVVKTVKFIKLTDAGKAYDHDAALAEDAAAKAAKDAE
jgi:DNA-binding MarR family transcriptional regulator